MKNTRLAPVRLAVDGGVPVRSAPWPAPGRKFGPEELRELESALAQNTLFYCYGDKTRQLCAEMARQSGAKHVLACSSGTAALHAAVKACGVGPGDEVITSPITDAGTLVGILYEGAVPVFADIDPRTCNLDPVSVEKRITPRTRAVIVVHLAGSPADIRAIVRICRPRGIAVIEDCAQAWGARVGGRWVGTFGDFGCFSFNDFKHIGCGDGGLIVTNRADLHTQAWLGIDKCYDRTQGGARRMDFVAPNYRITELQSAVALAQLRKLGGIVRKRNALGDRLSRGLKGIPGVRPHGVRPGAFCSYWFYLILLDPERLGVSAAEFARAMNAEGIPGNAGYVPPVYLAYPYLRNRTAFHHSTWPFPKGRRAPDYRPGLCPNAETVVANSFFFPINQWLSPREIQDAIRAVEKLAAAFVARRKPGRRPSA